MEYRRICNVLILSETHLIKILYYRYGSVLVGPRNSIKHDIKAKWFPLQQSAFKVLGINCKKVTKMEILK